MIIQLPDKPQVSVARRERLERLAEQTRRAPPANLAQLIREELTVDLSARYGGLAIPHPFGKASGQLSCTMPQVEADLEAGIAFIVLKTVIAEDETGERSMAGWAFKETRMKVERRVSGSGREGWNVSWKGRGWHGTLAEYVVFFEQALEIARASDIPVIPSVKYHLPSGDEPFRTEEYRHTTGRLLDVWARAGCGGDMLVEKDFSPTLAGDDRAGQQATILRWLSDVPSLIAEAGPGKVRVGVKLMNALFDDEFQVRMARAVGSPAAFMIAFNRLFDPAKKVAYGGYDLSDRNLRVLEILRGGGLLPISATGNICSGRLMLEYALRGAENGQVHTFFQVPLPQYTATGGSRTARALHTLMLHPEEGLVPWLWHLNETGRLEERGGMVRFLDIAA